jgi:predicted phosphodiesterase
MKIGILSDIHGNSEALREVLKAAESEGVEELIILGDFTGYYYHTDEVFDLLSEWRSISIKGNHDEMLEGIFNGSIRANDIRLKYGSGHEFALQNLSAAQLNFLFELPEKLSYTIDGVRLSLNHGSPWDKGFYIYPDAGPEIMERCDDPEYDFVLIGHSHYPFIHKNRHSTLINPGSVGQSRLEGGYANWALIDTENKSAALKATKYNISELISEIALNDPDIPYLREILLRRSEKKV